MNLPTLSPLPYRLSVSSHGQRFGALDPAVSAAVKQGALPDHFVPTPPKVIDLMIRKADFRAGQLILEPSAGQGHLAEAIGKATRYMDPPGQVDVVEIQPLLQSSLFDRGFRLAADNALAYNPGPIYDRILMNPPYQDGADVTHTLHCFNNLLKPGGKLIAVLPEAAFDLGFGSGKKVMINPATGNRYNRDLKNLLERPDVTVEVIPLPAEAFIESDVPRKVGTRLVVLTKKA